jgi:hypothetical protein
MYRTREFIRGYSFFLLFNIKLNMDKDGYHIFIFFVFLEVVSVVSVVAVVAGRVLS